MPRIRHFGPSNGSRQKMTSRRGRIGLLRLVSCLAGFLFAAVLTSPAASADELESVCALVEMLAAVDSQAAAVSLHGIRQRIQSGELAAERVTILAARLAPLVEECLQSSAPSPLRQAAVLLAATWRDATASQLAREWLADPRQPPALRLQALEALLAAHEAHLETILESMLDPDPATREFRRDMLPLLGRSPNPQRADLLLRQYPRIEADLQPRIVELLAQQPIWAARLLQAIQDGRVPQAAVNGNQLRQLALFRDPEIQSRITAIWGQLREERSPQREAVIEEVRKLLLARRGDPSRGAEVFARVCGQCHVIHGAGEAVGPDITANGRGSFEQLLSNVLDPSLVIGPAYQAYTIVTTHGRILTGLLEEESPQRLVLKMPGGQREAVLRDEVDELRVSQLSLMPEGLETQLTERELVDLFEFLLYDKHPSDAAARRMATH